MKSKMLAERYRLAGLPAARKTEIKKQEEQMSLQALEERDSCLSGQRTYRKIQKRKGGSQA
jgi:hypothetical protein